MAINYDQRKVKTNADAGAPYQLFNAEYDAVRYDSDSQSYLNANNDPYPFVTNIIDSNNRPAYGVGNYPSNSYSYAPNADNWQDYYSNRENYDGLFAAQKRNLTDVYGFQEDDANSVQGILSAYDPFTDYRTDFSNQNPLVGDFSTDTRTNLGTDQERAALNYIAEARGARKTARRKGFQGATLGAVISFLTAGAALGAGEAAGAAASAGTAAAPAAASTGGLFVGSGGVIGGTGSAIADAALNSAIQSGLTSAISGGNPLRGALTGGLSGGLGNALGGFDFGLGESGNSALAAALRGGVSSGISGGNPLIGAATAGLGSAASSLFNGGTSGFQFGDQNTGTEGVSFGGADGGSNGFRLPSDYNPDSNFDFSNSINNPFGSTENGGNLSDFNFNDIGGGDDFISQFFNGQQFGQSGIPLYLGGGFDSADSTNFLDQYFGGAGQSDDPSINSFLDQIFRQPGQTLDLSNSGGPDVAQSDNQSAPGQLPTGALQQLISRLLGSGAGGAGGGLAGLLGGNGGNFGQTLGNLTSGILTNSQKKAIEGARDTSVDLADPFRRQRGQYQTQLSNLLANPGSISSSPAFQGIYDLGLEAVNRNASAKGQLGSGNRLAALSDYGQKTASQYYFPQAQLLSNLAGVNAGSPATAAGINLAGTESAQGLRSKQGADFVGGLTGFQGNQKNDTLASLLGLLGNRGI